jgi:hypothetical protein
MSYIINNSRGQLVAVVADGTVNTTATSLALVGRAVTSYGEYENENYLFLLENFANSNPPAVPVLGQLWYNSATDQLSVYDSGNAWAALATEFYVEQQKISPIFTGMPRSPTAPLGTANAMIATTLFVQNAIDAKTTVETPPYGDNSTRIATTAFVQGEKFSPTFTGTPAAPTAATGTATTQIATTAFVTNSPRFLGSPTAPTAPAGTANTQIATTAFVTISPEFSGIPRAPTAPIGTASTQLATTEFVYSITGNLGTMSQQNANAVAIIGGSITGIDPLPVASGGTAANTPARARVNLGLGTMSTQNADAVAIAGGSIIGIQDLAVADGGTGASDPATARVNLGIGTLGAQNANAVNITGGSITGINPVPIASGGTAATTDFQARINLGLGTMAVQNANAVNIIGGSITGIDPLPITAGGTGANTAEQARINLGIANAISGLGTMAFQNSNSVSIIGGSITGIVPLPVVSGGTGANSPGPALNNLGGVPITRSVIATGGLAGGGSLATDITFSIATNSNGYGNRVVSQATPTGGNDGDIWYQI